MSSDPFPDQGPDAPEPPGPGPQSARGAETAAPRRRRAYAPQRGGRPPASMRTSIGRSVRREQPPCRASLLVTALKRAAKFRETAHTRYFPAQWLYLRMQRRSNVQTIMTQIVHPGSFPRVRCCYPPRAGLWLRDRSWFIGLCHVRVLSPHDGHRLLFQERHFVLSDLPDNRPVNAEIFVHRSR